jgi:hypothetical protein
MRDKMWWAGSKLDKATARDFIDQLASKSWKTGNDYHVKLKDGRTPTAARWLTDKLEEIEAAHGGGSQGDS